MEGEKKVLQVRKIQNILDKQMERTTDGMGQIKGQTQWNFKLESRRKVSDVLWVKMAHWQIIQNVQTPL